MIGISRVFALIVYQIIVINYFVLKSVPRSDQEHFNRLHQESNQLHCSWMFSRFGKNILIDWNDNLIDYFIEIINYIEYLINYRQL